MNLLTNLKLKTLPLKDFSLAMKILNMELGKKELEIQNF